MNPGLTSRAGLTSISLLRCPQCAVLLACLLAVRQASGQGDSIYAVGSTSAQVSLAGLVTAQAACTGPLGDKTECPAGWICDGAGTCVGEPKLFD